MPRHAIPGSTAIIGAGASGLSFARQLRYLGRKNAVNPQITLFERNKYIGGMCRHLMHSKMPALITEFGAGAVAPNYGLVIDAMKEHGVAFETMLPTNKDGLELEKLFNVTPWTKKPAFVAQLLRELALFNTDYKIYKQAKASKSDLPEVLKSPFSNYCQDRGITRLQMLLKPVVTGFGYGAFSDCPTYSILEYMGHTSMLDLAGSHFFLKHPPLQAVHGGYQFLMEQIAKDFDVKLDTSILEIRRDDYGILISYSHNDEVHQKRFDSLILANSPWYWPSLNMKLTDTEAECVEKLKRNCYSVAGCSIKGLTREQYFFPEAMEKENFGHVALLTTRDNRDSPEDGRFCTIYVNPPPGNTTYDIRDHWDSIVRDLKRIPGVTEVTFIEAVTWPSYLSSLDWQLRLQLDKEQSPRTMYAGSYTLGSFELVSSVFNSAANTVNQAYGNEILLVENSCSHFGSAYTFFNGKAYSPFGNNGFEPAQTKGWCSFPGGTG